MAKLALALYALYLALGLGLRCYVQWRRTGSTGFRGLSGRIGSAESIGGILLVVAVVAGIAAPALDLAGRMRPFAALDGPGLQAVGALLFLAGLAGTLGAQFTMGASWRIGVDPAERTQLVLGGPFRLVRNPIFSSMILAAAGLALLVPNVLALLAFACLFVGLEMHVRLVEEPYLTATHGESYRAWASRTGRFFPGLGKLR